MASGLKLSQKHQERSRKKLLKHIPTKLLKPCSLMDCMIVVCYGPCFLVWLQDKSRALVQLVNTPSSRCSCRYLKASANVVFACVPCLLRLNVHRPNSRTHPLSYPLKDCRIMSCSWREYSIALRILCQNLWPCIKSCNNKERQHTKQSSQSQTGTPAPLACVPCA